MTYSYTLVTKSGHLIGYQGGRNIVGIIQHLNLKFVGRPVKPGRRLIIVRAEVVSVTDGKSTTVALLQGTMIPTHPP